MDGKNLDQQDLEHVSGGYAEETNELRDFISTHDPAFTIRSETDIRRWLLTRSGIGFKGTSVNSDWYNNYLLSDSSVLSHEELMGMLKDRFPDE